MSLNILSRLRNAWNALVTNELHDVVGLQARLAEYELTMSQALDVIDVLDHANKGLNVSLARMDEEHEHTCRDHVVTIGTLLSATGGEVTLSKDIIEAVAASKVHFDYSVDESANTVTMKLRLEPEGDEVAEFEDDAAAEGPACSDCGSAACGG